MDDGHLTNAEVDALTAKAVKAETERCAKLIEFRAAISRNAAAKYRREGTYHGLFGGVHVHPRWEKNAKLCDEIAHSFDVVALCVRSGYDTDKEEPDARINTDEDWGNVGTEAGS